MIKIVIFLGIFVNFIAYENFYSAFSFLIVFYISRLSINIFLNKNIKQDRETEKDLSLWICSLFFLLTGVIELLIINYGSQQVVGPDASLFYKYASDPSWDLRSIVYENITGYSFEESSGFKEDFIPILVWNKVYNLFQNIGFPSGRYIGLSINTLFIVWTSFLGLNILRSINDLNNKETEKFYKILFCANGIFWMYGAIFIREAIIIFIITLLLKIWIDWIQKNSFFNLIKLGIISIIYYTIAPFLRGGYSTLLGAFILSFVIVELFKSFHNRKINLIQIISVPIILVLSVINFDFFYDAYNVFIERFETYNRISGATSEYGSIGIAILNMPFFIRIFFSIFYLLFMPIPIWSFIENNTLSIYHIFKSSFAIFNYLTIPFLIIVLKNSLFHIKRIDKTKLFLIVLYILTTFSIGITSLENRHYGNFSIIYLLLISYFNWDTISLRNEYKRVLSYLFIFLFILYFVYVFLKFKSIILLLIFLAVPLFITLFLKKENSRFK